MAASEGPLAGVKVLDLSRILAGPTCTQLLGDLGASVLKVENPRTGGDDTRQWGPPFVKDGAEDTDLSAYFMSANRNKRSIPIDIASEEGRAALRRLAGQADVLIENFKPGGLEKHGLGWEAVHALNPRLVYCSISGYGQTGPNRDRPGYDLVAQAFGGIMSLTGAPEGPPMKVGVGIADVMCGMYAAVGILAALRHAEATGEGQRIDLALVDSQVAWTINEGVATRLTGRTPARRGNEHPSIVPYALYPTSDGNVVVAVGNDGQFRRFCAAIGLDGLPDDPRFATNPARLENRAALTPLVEAAMRRFTTAEAMAAIDAVGVTVGPVQTLPEVFASEQARARGLCLDMPGPGGAVLPLIGNPLHLSRTPVTYRHPPPRFGADADRLDRDDPFED